MTSSGMSALVRWTCSATGRILSSAKRWKVSAASWKSSGRWLRPGADALERGRDRLEELGERCASTNGSASASSDRVDAPDRLASEQLGAELGERVGDERAREHRLDLAAARVVEHHLGALRPRWRRGRGRSASTWCSSSCATEMRPSTVARACEVIGGGGDDVGRGVDGRGRGGELVGHGRQPTDEPGGVLARSESYVARRQRSCSTRWRRRRVVVGSVAGARVRPAAGWCRVRCAGGVVCTVPPDEPEPDDPEPELGATCVLPSVSMVCLGRAGAPSASVTRALRVDELVHLPGQVVGAVRGEVHAVTRAHGDDLAGLVGQVGRELAVGVGEELVRVDVVHLRVALGDVLARPRSPARRRRPSVSSFSVGAPSQYTVRPGPINVFIIESTFCV